MSIYTENGFKNRRDYLENMSADFGVPFTTTLMLAQMLGPDEDFDGLVCALDDASRELNN